MLAGFERDVIFDEEFKGICTYKGRTLAEKTAISPSQLSMKIKYIMAEEHNLTILNNIGWHMWCPFGFATL